MNLVRGLARVCVVGTVERRRADRFPLVLMVEKQPARTLAPAKAWKPDKARGVETDVLMIRANTHVIAELGRRVSEDCGPVGGHSDVTFRFANGPAQVPFGPFRPGRRIPAELPFSGRDHSPLSVRRDIVPNGT